MKQILSVLLCLFLGIACMNTTCSNTSGIKTREETKSSVEDKEAIEIEKAARDILQELSYGKPKGSTVFYKNVKNNIAALVFVHQMILLHTKNFLLVDEQTNSYKYESKLVKVYYTENPEHLKDIAKVSIIFNNIKQSYTLIFRKSNVLDTVD